MKNTEKFAARLIELGGKEWKNYGKHRIYFNEELIQNLLGIEINKYKSGNISSASRDGKRISNASAGRYLTAVIYFDVDTNFTVTAAPMSNSEQEEVHEALRNLRAEIEKEEIEEMAEEKVRILVVDKITDGDEFIEECETLEAANAEARTQWDRLTDHDKRKGRRVFVVTEHPATEDGVDWDIPAGAWDSDDLDVKMEDLQQLNEDSFSEEYHIGKYKFKAERYYYNEIYPKVRISVIKEDGELDYIENINFEPAEDPHPATDAADWDQYGLDVWTVIENWIKNNG